MSFVFKRDGRRERVAFDKIVSVLGKLRFRQAMWWVV